MPEVHGSTYDDDTDKGDEDDGKLLADQVVRQNPTKATSALRCSAHLGATTHNVVAHDSNTHDGAFTSLTVLEDSNTHNSVTHSLVVPSVSNQKMITDPTSYWSTPVFVTTVPTST